VLFDPAPGGALVRACTGQYKVETAPRCLAHLGAPGARRGVRARGAPPARRPPIAAGAWYNYLDGGFSVLGVRFGGLKSVPFGLPDGLFSRRSPLAEESSGPGQGGTQSPSPNQTPISAPRTYGWIGQGPSSGFCDLTPATLGVFASLDRF
jgi:hypothetical protein